MKSSASKERPNRSANSTRQRLPTGDEKAKTLDSNMRSLFQLQDNRNLLEGLDLIESHPQQDFSDLGSQPQEQENALILKQQSSIQDLQKYYDLYIQQCFLLDLDYSQHNLDNVLLLTKELKKQVEQQNSLIDSLQFHKDISFKTILSLEQKNESLEHELAALHQGLPKGSPGKDSSHSLQDKIEGEIVKSLEQEATCCQKQSMQDLLKEIHSLQFQEQEHHRIQKEYQQHSQQFTLWKQEQQKNIITLRQQLQQQDDKYTEQLCQIQQQQQKMHKMNQQISQWKERGGKAEQQLSQERHNLRQSKQEIENKEEQINEMNKQLVEKQAEIQSLRGQVADGKDQLEEQQGQVQLIQKKITQLSQQKHSQKKVEQALREEMEEQVQVINRMGLELERLSRQLEEQQRQGHMEMQDKEREGQERLVLQRQNSLSEEKELRRQLRSVQELKEQLQQHNHSLKHSIEQLQASCCEAQEREERLQLDLAEERQRKQVLEEQLVGYKVKEGQVFQMVFKECSQDTIGRVLHLIN